MYFYKKKGVQHLDLRGDFILSFNDALVKTGTTSAGPRTIKAPHGYVLNLGKAGFFKRIGVTLRIIAFVWGKDKELVEANTGLKKPYVKEKPTDYDTETEGREDCPVIKKHCEYYAYQCDSNGDVNLTHCTHPDNIDDHEGNTISSLCPIVDIDANMINPAIPWDRE